MYKLINILIIGLFVNIAYSQCIADPGEYDTFILPHNNSPGGEISLDGSGTEGDNPNFECTKPY